MKFDPFVQHSEWGLFAKTKIRKGQLVAIIPFSALFCRDLHANKQLVQLTDSLYTYDVPPLRPLTPSELEKEPNSVLSHFAANLQLSVLLMMEMHNPRSDWKPFLDILPNMERKTYNGLFLDDQKIAEYLTTYINHYKLPNSAATLLQRAGTRVSKFVDELNDLFEIMMHDEQVFIPMISRFAKAKYSGDLQKAKDAFRLSWSIVHARHIVDIAVRPDELLQKIPDPYAHVDPKKREKYDSFYKNGPQAATKEKVTVGRPEKKADKYFDISDMPIITAPFIAPLLDSINHGDPNTLYHFAPCAPFSVSQMRLIERAYLDVMPREEFETLSKNPEKLGRYIWILATKDIEPEEQLFREYASQLDVSRDLFLSTYGFIPKVCLLVPFFCNLVVEYG